MINPDTLYLNRDREKTIAKYDDILKSVGATGEELNILIKLCQELGFNKKQVNYIEIGVWLGGTFNYILDQCKNININAIGIDLFEDFEIKNDGNTHYGDVANMSDIFQKLKENGHTNFTLLKGNSADVISKLDKLDNVVCFIDGDHSYEGVKRDFNSILQKIKSGYIAFDDMDWESVFKFFNEIKKDFEIVEWNSRMAVIKIY